MTMFSSKTTTTSTSSKTMSTTTELMMQQSIREREALQQVLNMKNTKKMTQSNNRKHRTASTTDAADVGPLSSSSSHEQRSPPPSSSPNTPENNNANNNSNINNKKPKRNRRRRKHMSPQSDGDNTNTNGQSRPLSHSQHPPQHHHNPQYQQVKEAMMMINNNNSNNGSSHRHRGGGSSKKAATTTAATANTSTLSNLVASYGSGTYCAASRGGPTSTKQHDAPLTKRDLYFSLHVTTTTTTADNHNTAPARVTLVNWDNDVVLDTLVNETIAAAAASAVTTSSPTTTSTMSFDNVRSMLSQTLRGKILIGHSLEQQLNVVGVDHPLNDRRDCATFESFGINEVDGVSMTKVWTPRPIDELSIEILSKTLPSPSEPTRPLECCFASLDLYKRYRKEWEEWIAAKARQQAAEAAAAPPQQQRQHHQKPHDVTNPRHRTNMSARFIGLNHPHRPSGGGGGGVNQSYYMLQQPHIHHRQQQQQNHQQQHPPLVDVVALHCLMVKTASRPCNVARVTMIGGGFNNNNNEILLDTFVRIPGRVIDCYDTGITWDDVSARSNPSAMAFSDVRKAVVELLKNKLLVGHGLGWFMKALDIGHPFALSRDTATFRPFMYEEINELNGTRNLIERSIDDLSIDILQSSLSPPGDRRRPVDCCVASLELYKTYRNQWEGMLPEHKRYYPRTVPAMADGGVTMESTVPSSSSSSATNGRWFSWGRKNGGAQQQQQLLQQNHQEHHQPPTGSSNVSQQAFQVLNDHNHHQQHIVPNATVVTQDLYFDQRQQQLHLATSSYHGSSSVSSSYVHGPGSVTGSSHYGTTAYSSTNGGESVAAASSSFDYDAEGSVISSLHDDASSVFSGDGGHMNVPATPANIPSNKNSSWFRFGSRKSRYSSPTSRVSMMAVEEADEMEELVLTPSAVGGTVGKSPSSRGRSLLSFHNPLYPTGSGTGNVDADNMGALKGAPMLPDAGMTTDGDAAQAVSTEAAAQTSSRSWFGFRRRSCSPARRRGSNAKNRRSVSPPLTPDTNPDTLGESDRDRDEPPSPLSSSPDEMALTPSPPAPVPSDSVDGRYDEHVDVTYVESSLEQATTPERKSSLSWFSMRRGAKSPTVTKKVMNLEAANESMTTFVSDLERSATEPTEKSNDDWLQEVMSQSESQANTNDDISSVGYQPWMDQADEVANEKGEPSNKKAGKSRGQTSWFGFKRRDSTSRRASRLAETTEEPDDYNTPDAPPDSVSFVFDSSTAKMSAQQYNVPSSATVVPPQSHSSLMAAAPWMLVHNGALPEFQNNSNGGPSPATPNSRDDTVASSSPASLVGEDILRDAFSVGGGGRDRLNTASTIPSITSDGYPGQYDDIGSSGSDDENFSHQFEQGVVQNLAFLEI